jgi:hypothetical protein
MLEKKALSEYLDYSKEKMLGLDHLKEYQVG